MRGQLSEALRIINCLRALARVFMIQRNEADVPGMLTEPGKWLDGATQLFKRTSETRHWVLLWFLVNILFLALQHPCCSKR